MIALQLNAYQYHALQLLIAELTTVNTKRNLAVLVLTDKAFCRKFYGPVQFVFAEKRNTKRVSITVAQAVAFVQVCTYHIIENSPKEYLQQVFEQIHQQLV